MLADEEIFVRDTERAELARIHAMEQGDARSFIIPYSLERHELEFGSQGVFYKSIWVDRQIIGFLILALESDGRSIEFRRIVLSETGRGYGKKVVTMVDEICRQEFGRTRLWLDVLSRIHERAMYMTSVAITFSDVPNTKEELYCYMKRRVTMETRIRSGRVIGLGQRTRLANRWTLIPTWRV